MHGAGAVRRHERWFLNEKDSMAAVEALPVKPEWFSEAASRLLTCPGPDAKALPESVSRCELLLGEVRRSCGARSN